MCPLMVYLVFHSFSLIAEDVCRDLRILFFFKESQISKVQDWPADVKRILRGGFGGVCIRPSRPRSDWGCCLYKFLRSSRTYIIPWILWTTCNNCITCIYWITWSTCITCICVSIRPSRPGSEDAAFTSKNSERTNKGENGGLHQFGPNRIKNSKTCALLISDYKVQNTLANEYNQFPKWLK